MWGLLVIATAGADPIELAGAGLGATEDLPAPVVGGVVVDHDGWQDAVGVVFYGSYVGCTGTLIAPDVVLTAGHCADGITHVVVGTLEWDRGGEWIDVDQVWEYPSSWSTYDVAVLQLERDADQIPRALAMDCVLDFYLNDGADVAIVGYGATNGAGTASTDKLHEGFSTVADADCSQDQIDGWWSGCNQAARPGGEIAAGGDGVDSCFGDSGGPLYLQTPAGDFLVGVTSRGYADVPYNQPCLYGGVYTRPDAVVDWIEDKVGHAVTYPMCNRAPEPTAAPIDVVSGGRATTRIDAQDPDGAVVRLGYEIVAPPAHGVAEVDDDGVVTFTADAGYQGPDALVVSVDDGGHPDWPRTGPALAAEVEIAIVILPAGLGIDAGGGPQDSVDGTDPSYTYVPGGCTCASAPRPPMLWLALAALARTRSTSRQGSRRG